MAGLMVLPLAVFVWWRQRDGIDIHDLVDVTLLVSMMFAPFGWSFDFVVLLLPVVRMVVWIFRDGFGRFESITLISVLLIVYGLSLYQRFLPQPEEAYFFWIPFAIAGLYLWIRVRYKQKRS
jgi:uncharacterized membrane protein YczE